MNDLITELVGFHEGVNHEAYNIFGAHADSGGNVTFRVWAPHASGVHLVGDFNDWNISATPMVQVADGVYEITLNDIPKYSNYKYAIHHADGNVRMMADPYAFYAETSGGTASKVWFLDEGFSWSDASYLKGRADSDSLHSPMNIYEAHPATWRRLSDGGYYDYTRLAEELIPYVKEMGYTHLELMPLSEYPRDDSSGYDPTGFFAVTARYGTPEGFMKLVDAAHKEGLGVILDWVPSRFASDDWALIRYDGDVLYEDPTRGNSDGWGTSVFDYSKPQVRSFLISGAMLFLKEYHVDALRIGLLSEMQYMEAEGFLKELTEAVSLEVPGAMIFGSGSAMGQLVTAAPCEGGLGFDYMWNSGWARDMESYLRTDPYFRKQQHNRLTFPMSHAFSEKHIVIVSHEEVSGGRKSLMEKLPGEYDIKFDGYRGFLLYMMSQPGKKLTFMGTEFGQFDEWNHARPLDWNLLEYDRHRQLEEYVKDLNHFYLEHPELWQEDDSWKGFQWINADDAENNILVYRRIATDGRQLIFVVNFAPVERKYYRIEVMEDRPYREIFNSDETKYGGTGVTNPGDIIPVTSQGSRRGQYIELSLGPLGAVAIC